jgi:hypothetical protein
MANATTKDKMEFSYIMAKHSTITLHAIQRLMRYGSTMNRLATQQCNDPSWGASHEQQRRNIQRKVTDLLEPYKCHAVFSNDPRGATIKVAVPDGFYTDWGKEGICVPTS